MDFTDYFFSFDWLGFVCVGWFVFWAVIYAIRCLILAIASVICFIMDARDMQKWWLKEQDKHFSDYGVYPQELPREDTPKSWILTKDEWRGKGKRHER